MFVINCIEIFKECPDYLRKCLLPKRYYFNDRIKLEKNILRINNGSVGFCIPDFWSDSEKIHVQAIAGKNGSGKSSLLDLMYMAINNFAYMFERGYERGGAESLCFVKHLNVRLFYTIDNQNYALTCTEEKVLLTQLNVDAPIKNGIIVANGSFEIGKNHRKINKLDPSAVKNLLSNFFYTVVSNYSIQSFIASNYKCDLFIHNLSTHEDDTPENVNSYGYKWNEKRDKNDSKEKIWINSVFHKNDGYIRSLCLNPYRSNGIINADQEQTLSVERLIALVIKDKRLDERYSLKKITASISGEKCSEIFSFYKKTVEKDYDKREYESKTGIINNRNRTKVYFAPQNIQSGILKWIQFCLKCANNPFIDLVNVFSLKITPSSPYYKLVGLAYLYKKICKIIKVYSCYHKYKSFCLKKDRMSYQSFNNINELAKQINEDTSHVATKVHRIIHFLRLKDSAINKKYDVETYIKNFNHYRQFDLDDVMDHLPPSIYTMDIFLKDQQGVIPYKKLSSGEQQMLQNISSHLYHVRNLISIQTADLAHPDPNRPVYKNINLIFDEVEISFHPEYQRKFVYLLVGMLERYVEYCSFNVFIVSHSPFILSDIPNKNILYLDEGKIANKSKDKTFGANINNLCKDSFFLSNGFVGEYAKGKVSSLVKYLKSRSKTNNSWDKNKARKFINEIIGEQIVQDCLIQMFESKFEKEI